MGTHVAGVTGLASRVAKLESPAKAGERPGVVVLPPILPVDVWEAIAEPMQRELVLATHEGLDRAG